MLKFEEQVSFYSEEVYNRKISDFSVVPFPWRARKNGHLENFRIYPLEIDFRLLPDVKI